VANLPGREKGVQASKCPGTAKDLLFASMVPHEVKIRRRGAQVVWALVLEEGRVVGVWLWRSMLLGRGGQVEGVAGPR